MSIVEFLLARIAEDEALARGAIQDGGEAGPWLVGMDTADHLDPNTVFRPSMWAGNIVHACSTYLAEEDQLDVARHIARNDPARVLSECAAKRAVLDLLTVAEQHLADVRRSASEYRFVSAAESPRDAILCAVQLLAAVYADHPDYNREWRT